MRIPLLIGIALLGAAPTFVAAAEPLALDDETARINYSLGYQVGGDFKRQGVEMNAEAIVRGIEDALAGAEPLMKPEDMQATLVELKRRIVAEEKTRKAERELQQQEEGRKFLEENAKKDGVTTTDSGLQYQVVEPGTGKTPGPTDQVTVSYRGSLVNGQEFDSSYSRGKPATFPLNGVIKGWTEGLQLVSEGGRIKLFIPPELAYGDRGPLANRTLIFDVELISVGAPEASGTSAESASATGK